MFAKKCLPILALMLMSTLCFSQLVNNVTELNIAINAASPGTTIVLADGTWNDTFISLNKNGSSTAPIEITAQNPGAVLMTGNSRVYMEGSYLTVSGLVFQNPINLVNNGGTIAPVIELKRCDNCKVLNNKIDRYNGAESQKEMKFKWVVNDGQNNEIAYNSFIGKYGVGSIINDNRNSNLPDYLKIHHNYFADRIPINGIDDDNDQDAIRIGNSGTSLSNSFSEVYENYFYNFFGEVEVISNKSGQNKYYNNTFRDYSGTLTIRHGDDCEVYGNYFFAENNVFSGGIRVIGEGHKIYNNYIEGVNSFKADGSPSNATGGINVSNGRFNSALNGYYQVKNAQIVNNTFVDCDYGLRIGTTISSDLDQEPENLIVANNIMYNTSIDPYQIATPPSGTSLSEGNITSLLTSDMVDDGNFHRLTNIGTPIGAGVGSYPYLTTDILDGNRDANFDAGAEEFGGAGTRLPYNGLDVGVDLGFTGLASPILSVFPLALNFGIAGGTMTFEIDASVDWDIIENLPWLTLDVISGAGTTIVTATAIQNITGSPRTGTITVNEIPGGNDLSAILSVSQLNAFPGTGEVIVTEYHNRPQKPTQTQLNAALPNNPLGADTTPNEGHTEWFEIYNTTNAPVVMDGWTLTDASNNSNVVTIDNFTIAANSYAVFSGFNIPSAQGGIVFDYFYDYKKLSFSNESSYSDVGDTTCPDGVIIKKADGTLVDEVRYDYGYGEYLGNVFSGNCSSNTIPIGLPSAGSSSRTSFMLNFDPAIMNSANNNLASNWSFSTILYDEISNQKGTPGQQNDLMIYCVPNMILSGLNSTTELHEAEFSISSTEQIVGSATIDYSAGDEINLEGGFEVLLGAEFNVYMFGCGQ